MKRLLILCLLVFLLPSVLYPQAGAGKLFIIGGGKRPPALLGGLVEAAGLGKQDYIVVLPMASEDRAAAFKSVESELKSLVRSKIVDLGFSSHRLGPPPLDSLKNAKLIFITGGDQERFMASARNSGIGKAIQYAYRKGSTIAGTSAGAAVMSTHMITGNQLLPDTTYKETFDKLKQGNIEFKPGLGLLDSVIIDQHFVRRSRYNRLLSALERFPDYAGLGIDESTAILVRGKRARVIGESQVVVLKEPVDIRAGRGGLIRLKDVKFSIFTEGDEFDLP
ncbi:cyanophycinase [Arcticibacter sp. MXS-1]|uniref:cyanophycinase n=1 Tax=Arcticibacter sp. MXS-1 TaxID=3341726 RepID=UPI0035A8AB60